MKFRKQSYDVYVIIINTRPFQGGSFVMILCCLFFGVRVSVTFHLMCFHIIFSSVWVAEWPFFGKKLLTRLTICSLCILTIFNFNYLTFGF